MEGLLQLLSFVWTARKRVINSLLFIAIESRVESNYSTYAGAIDDDCQ